jgi:light-regulated signal transduction histidine kinase (bacteriophytochrome)
MQVLINDLLSFSRLSSPLQHFEKTDLNRVLEEILTDLEITIKEKNARFIISALPQVEVVPGQIRQVFQNIISNSLKFCSKDAVPVIKVYSETRQNTVQIYIEDNGIGFDEKYLDRIFTIFQRLHSREDFEGTGIGLAICKKVMENHSGEITARSRVNEGSCFILTLPLTQEKNKE